MTISIPLWVLITLAPVVAFFVWLSVREEPRGMWAIDLAPLFALPLMIIGVLIGLLIHAWGWL